MEVLFLEETNPDYTEVLNLLLQLRPAYKNVDIISQHVSNQMKNGYQIAYVKSSEGHIPAAAGFVVSEKPVWGKHIYIDDWITEEKHQLTGVESFFMDWFKSHCDELGCVSISSKSYVYFRT